MRSEIKYIFLFIIADAPQKVQPVSAFVPSTKPSVASNSVLKDILQNKTNTVDVESKNELNTFMGQKICSPTTSITSSKKLF